MPYILDIIVIFQHFQQLLHLGDGFLIGQLDCGGRYIFQLSRYKSITLCHQCITDCIKIFRCCCNFKTVFFFIEVIRGTPIVVRGTIGGGNWRTPRD